MLFHEALLPKNNLQHLIILYTLAGHKTKTLKQKFMKQKVLKISSTIILLLLVAIKLQAQVAALPFTASLDSFYEITGTTVDAMYADDVVYENIPIGFDFYLGGTAHDKMSINTNGYIELDSNGTSTFVNIMNGTQNNYGNPCTSNMSIDLRVSQGFPYYR